MIADHQGLADLIARLSPLSRIAVDTEADSFYHYFDKTCLVQISTELENVLVDPLAGFSLQPLYEFLTNRQLILHGADHDLRMLHRGGHFADGCETLGGEQGLLGLAPLGVVDAKESDLAHRPP